MSVSPCLIGAKDLNSTEIKVWGKFFGSPVSRGYNLELYRHVDILIENIYCKNTIFVSDEELMCVGPPNLVGLLQVSVKVKSGLEYI